MKILFAATTPMAVNAFLKGHLRALAQEHDIVLAVNTNSFPLDDEVAGYVEVVDIPFERKISLLRDLQCLAQMVWLMLRVKPDAVHSIMPKTGLLSMAAAFLARCPKRSHTFTGQVWVTQQGWRRGLLKMFDRIIAGLATTVLADSHSQARFIEAEGIARANSVLVLGEGSIGGVDANRFKPDEATRNALRSQLHAQPDDCVFLFLGRLTRDKGIHDLLEAFAGVTESNPKCSLWLAGPDDEQFEETWRAASGVVSKRIAWIGLTDRPEHYMAAADVFVLPSYREGFGLVVIEAAACATPTIAYEIPGVVDAVADGKSGALVPVGDINALAQGMLSLSTDQSKRGVLGTQARDRVMQLFDSQAITQQWVEFYLVGDETDL